MAMTFQRMVAEYSRLGEVRFMDEKRQLALEFIGQHPGSFLRLCGKRFFKFWTSPDGSAWMVVSLLAWLGMIFGLRKKGLEAVPHAIVLVTFPRRLLRHPHRQYVSPSRRTRHNRAGSVRQRHDRTGARPAIAPDRVENIPKPLPPHDW